MKNRYPHLYLIALVLLLAGCLKREADVVPPGFSEFQVRDLRVETLQNTPVLIDLADSLAIKQPHQLSVEQPRQGQMLATATGFVYSPAAGFAGVDTLIYNACVSGNCKTGRIFLTVVDTTTPCFVQARDDSGYVPFMTAVLLPVLANDQVCPGTVLRLPANQTVDGSLNIVGGDQIEFTPTGTTPSQVFFFYEICRGGQCSQARVSLNVEDSAAICWQSYMPEPDTLTHSDRVTGTQSYPTSALTANDINCPSRVQVTAIRVVNTGGMVETRFRVNTPDLANGWFSVTRLFGSGSQPFMGTIEYDVQFQNQPASRRTVTSKIRF